MLPKRECLILISGYDLRLWVIIVDRFQKLENINLLSGIEYARELLTLEDDNIRLNLDINN